MYFNKYTQKIEFYSTLLYSIMEGTYYTYFRIFVQNIWTMRVLYKILGFRVHNRIILV